MYLRNYDNVMVAKNLCSYSKQCISQGEHTNFGDGHLTVKTTGAQIYRIFGGASDCLRQVFDMSSYYVGEGLTFGSGDTPVAYDDYALSVPATDSVCSHVSYSLSDTTYDEATDTFKRTMKRIFAAKQDLVIKEIGWVTRISGSSSQTVSSGSEYGCLVYRKVLDEPISVEANSNFELTFTTVVSSCANKPTEYEASVVTE